MNKTDYAVMEVSITSKILTLNYIQPPDTINNQIFMLSRSIDSKSNDDNNIYKNDSIIYEKDDQDTATIENKLKDDDNSNGELQWSSTKFPHELTQADNMFNKDSLCLLMEKG